MKKYKATVTALPARWNTFHWVVAPLEDTGTGDKSFYFSQNASLRPADNSEVGDTGFIHQRFLNGSESSWVWCWTTEEKDAKPKKKEEVTLDEWLEGED